MATAQQASQNNPEQLISTVLAAEMPFWVRLVEECKEEFESECASPDAEPDPFAELKVLP